MAEESGRMKVLELFAGTRSISKAFERRGHEVYTVEWSHEFPDISLYTDVALLTAGDIIKLCGGKPDVIWASPDCTSYSIAAISHHRDREPDGNLAPRSEYAKFCDKVNMHVVELIKELEPKYYFIENPRGGMRKMRFMKDLPRYTVCYCFAGETRVITKGGTYEIRDLVDTEPILLTSQGWKKAPIREYGVQELMKLTLSRSGKLKTIFATPEHEWILKTGGLRKTCELHTGNRLKYAELPKVQEAPKIKHQAKCWSVVSVEKTDRVETVYCADVPDVHDFALEDGLLTHNCRYGDKRMKPTDIWTNHPDPQFEPMCHNGCDDHEKAPRGAKTGTQGLKGATERARIPDLLCDHIAEICER